MTYYSKKTLTDNGIRPKSGYIEEFEYSAEWYGGSYSQKWLSKIKSPDDLVDHYRSQQASFDRMHDWYAPLTPTGRLLELGHNDGKSVYYLAEEKKDIGSIDCIDFNESLKPLEPHLRALIPKIDNIWYEDCRKIKVPDGHYNTINCIDFYEHLPTDVYHESMAECSRVLQVGGIMAVFFGKGKGPAHPEHINVLPDEQVIVDMYGHGFKFLDVNGYHRLLIFIKSDPTIKLEPITLP